MGFLSLDEVVLDERVYELTAGSRHGGLRR
jgi:hypothetical protein